MANFKREPVSYRRFVADPLLQEGLLPVARPDGELERKVASAMFRMADEAGAINDARAEREGALAGEQAGLAGRPRTSVTPGSAGQIGSDGKPYKTNDPVATDLPAPARALLNAISGGESGGAYNVRYTPQGGAYFSDLSRHPRIKEAGPHGVSTAAGRYQFLGSTWDGLGGGDFSPANQDHRAWQLAQQDYKARTGRPLLADLEANGLTPGIVSALAPTWEALKANQGRHIATYEDSLIRFVGQGKMPPPAGRARPASVDPSVQSPGVVEKPFEVTGGGWRPTGRDTVAGRAWDAAGTRTYLQALNAEVESTTEQLYEKFKDQPGTLQQALGALKGEQFKEHVFDEIAAEYELTFDRRAGGLVMKAQRELEQKREAQNRADFLDRTGTLSTEMARKLAGFDPTDPTAADAIWALQAQIDEHYDASVAHGILAPETAQRAKAESRRDNAVTFYTKQAESLDPEKVKATREKMAADFAAGGLDGIDAEGFERLQGNLLKLEDQAARADAAAETALAARATQFAKRLALGFEPDPAELARFALDSGTAKNGPELLRSTYATLSAARAIGRMSLPQAADYVAGLKKQYGNAPTDGQLATLATAADLYEAKRQAIQADQVSYAEERGLQPPTPFLTQAQDGQQVVEILQARRDGAAAQGEKLGVSPRFLKKGEAAAIGKAIRAAPESGAALAGAIVMGAGEDVSAVLAEFGDDAPMVAEAGAILAGGGSQKAAEDVIFGYGKSPEGKPLKGLKADAAAQNFASVAGDSLAYARRDAGRVERAAAAIARKRISEDGLDPESDEAAAVYSQAVQEAAGALFDRGVQWGGFAETGGTWAGGGSKVLVPSDIRADLFGDVLAAVTDADLAALKVKPLAGSMYTPLGAQKMTLAQTLAGARPIAVELPGGRKGFAFAAGSSLADPQFIMGDDGQPFVLDVMGMRDTLAPRVPGAFR